MSTHQALLQYVFAQSDSKKLRPIKTENIQKKLNIFDFNLNHSCLLLTAFLSFVLALLDVSNTVAVAATIFILSVAALPLFIRMNNIKSVSTEMLIKLETTNRDETYLALQSLAKEQGFLLEGQYHAALQINEDKNESEIKEKWGIK